MEPTQHPEMKILGVEFDPRDVLGVEYRYERDGEAVLEIVVRNQGRLIFESLMDENKREEIRKGFWEMARVADL